MQNEFVVVLLPTLVGNGLPTGALPAIEVIGALLSIRLQLRRGWPRRKS